MSEVNNCCGTTCDKAKAVAEYDALLADNARLNSLVNEMSELCLTNAEADAMVARGVEKFVTALGAAWRSDWDMLEISEFADEFARGLV